MGMVRTAPSSAPSAFPVSSQRPAFVRAMILDRIDLVLSGSKDPDLALRRLHATGTAQGNVVDRTDGDPVHGACSLLFHIHPPLEGEGRTEGPGWGDKLQ